MKEGISNDKTVPRKVATLRNRAKPKPLSPPTQEWDQEKLMETFPARYTYFIFCFLLFFSFLFPPFFYFSTSVYFIVIIIVLLLLFNFIFSAFIRSYFPFLIVFFIGIFFPFRIISIVVPANL